MQHSVKRAAEFGNITLINAALDLYSNLIKVVFQHFAELTQQLPIDPNHCEVTALPYCNAHAHIRV